jgi:uncharacterized membrane protein YoaK (UPF0700 family)
MDIHRTAVYFRTSRNMSVRNATWKAGLALLLAGVAGFADAVGYLTLHQIFTAHMTGNTTKLGIALGDGSISAAYPLAAAVLGFVAGVGAGTLIVDGGRRRAALLAEAALIAAFMVYGATVLHHGHAPDHAAGFYVLLSLLTMGLGIQSATLTRVGGATVRTSYISGVLTNLGQAGARRLRGRPSGQEQTGLLLLLCLCYLAAATAGAFGLSHLGIWCLAAPAGVLLVAAAFDR